MYRLWAPWRSQYVRQEEKERECIFCKKPQENEDEKNYILLRGKFCFVIMNRFPYNNGHLMIAPYRHIPSIEQLNPEESLEMMELLRKMIKILKETLHPEGFNIGINLGKAAGAGIVDHVHLHLVPRWIGDYNFMPLFSETKVIPEALEMTYKELKEKLQLKEKEQ